MISSRRFAEHAPPPGHPERPDRAYVFDAVAARWREHGGTTTVPVSAANEDLARVHHQAYLGLLAGTAGRSVELDPDTFTSPASEPIARLAAGAAVQAADHARRTAEPAFALVRPPGHHAERDRAMGFCFYNNVAIAAAAMRAQGLQRVAIVDVDVHHGNGTQNSFYDDPHVLYISTHQFPFYPGTGAAEETGNGAGAGYTVNVPIEAGATDADYLRIHDTVVLPVLDAFRPELTIVSAGYDAHEDDPLASMRMTASGFGCLFRDLAGVARRHGAFCAVTEGGYALEALAACLEASLRAIRETFSAGARTDRSARPDGRVTVRSERAISAVRAAQRAFWFDL